jgi:DNA-binding NtrC family response regulator
VTIERVASRPDLERALDQSIWDVVLSDHSMPGFSSVDALELVQARGLDLPVIVVSGHIGEDAAVEAMREGARDYVPKSSLQRLGVAVRRALRDAAGRATLLQRERDLEALHEVPGPAADRTPGTAGG